MSDPILIMRDLKKYFTVGYTGIVKRSPITVRAVDGVSLELMAGETFGLVGESGSGKSTIAYMVAGMYAPTAGELRFNGRNLFEGGDSRPLDLKKEIQIVFQDPGSSLNPRRTIAQNLAVPLQVHKPDRDLVTETLRLLELVDLPPSYMYRYPNMLSGGEKQIVAIARALATDPSMVETNTAAGSADRALTISTQSRACR